MVSFGIVVPGTDYMPVYFQAVQNASAIGSGVDIFPITFTIPFSALATGISVKALKKYRPQNYIGWAITLIGFGAITRLDADSTRAQYICSQIPLGIGLGIVWVGTQFPILAPLPVSNNAHALAFFTFTRRFAQVCAPSPFHQYAHLLLRVGRAGASSSAERSCRTSSSRTFRPPTSRPSRKVYSLRTPSSQTSGALTQNFVAKCRLPSRTRRKSSGRRCLASRASGF